MEPEYIAVSGNYAYVTLQENNALAKIDISSATPTVMGVQSLGAKDYETENTIDILRDDQAYMTNYTALKGLYMPDSVASYVAADNKTYIVTANEGDGREYCLDTDPDCDDPVYADEKRISSGTLQKALISSLETYYKDLEDEVGDIDMVKSLLDMTDVDNESVFIMGGRSFSIWDENGSLVFDSGSQLSNLTAKFMPTLFNQDEGKMDKRSDDKGVEPEALTVGTIGTKTYAFIGLERQNAIVIYDITTPTKSKFVKYIPTEEDGDISPEGMKFIAASDSPTGNALLLVAFEVSGTTAVYEIK